MKKYQTPAESKINLTPMLDVVFIMLIFFIVTASFVREVGIGVNPPEPGNNPPPPDKTIILVKINANNQIVVAGSLADRRTIRAHFERLHAQNPGAPVVIAPHPNSNTQAMVDVMDSARASGIWDIMIADQ